MRLVQFRDRDGRRAVAAREAIEPPRRLMDCETVYELALDAIETGRSLVELARQMRGRETVDLDTVEAEGRLLPPIEHPVPTRCWITGTGLTHLGGAEARDKLLQQLSGDEASLSDSLKMVKWCVEGGKPAAGAIGVQPEWFFKGNGSTLVGSGQPLPLPDFALGVGEEPELVGLYIIADDGTPCRLGWALGNEFTDHAMEKQNHLYLAHAKLRASAVGPELLLGDLPDDVRGTARILRGDQTVWERPFVSGESNMTHRFASLEHHHFKYPMFRRPGDVHLHFFGASTLSYLDGARTEPGDVFEIAAPIFGRPLRNQLKRVTWPAPTIRVL